MRWGLEACRAAASVVGSEGRAVYGNFFLVGWSRAQAGVRRTERSFADGRHKGRLLALA